MINNYSQRDEEMGYHDINNSDDENNDSGSWLKKSPKTKSHNKGIKEVLSKVNLESEQIQLEIDEVLDAKINFV